MADLMSNDMFLAFSTYATIVVLKMMFMAPLTGYFRITRKGAFSNSEDRKKMLQTNPDVERVRSGSILSDLNHRPPCKYCAKIPVALE
uniref:Microsomal glutathione S-transferase 1 n=1 Tax=Cyprinus carpio TaxID=7962 RepID=A0A8C2HX32_CYPCA